MDEWCLYHELMHPVIDSFKDMVEDETNFLIHELPIENPGRK